MNQLLSVFSVGNVMDILAGIFGWSPQGRRISLEWVEGPGRDLIEGRNFLVTELQDVSLVVAAEDANTGGRYLLRPRHRGWTARSLMGTSIAVTVHPLTVTGAGDAVGIAVVRLGRKA